ncbi:PUCC protein [Chloroherpeton thalassium ATCC 35110]|uniref:PUCC protein n=1 Tax=Chloroherpeton thalassium (strain ATCC 35110 / GB-78) TaxID=517418 RepID=B3QVP1_CHLT3|nr:BCD family MFS transporter [Chloroherpeton thalassium]ACF13098.1 PUCC protein [Chloroherpeton thalassium ATCC 35110]
MNIFKNIRLGLVHVGVAITFIPINGVLNRVMIHEMEMLASVVAALLIFPYLLSPLQLYIGRYSDTHPTFGYKRTPYILLGAVLCLAGSQIAPHAALSMSENFAGGLMLAIVAFGAWGLGYNLAAVSYLSLASDMANPKDRSRVISVMWFMMIAGIIITAASVGRALDPFTMDGLFQVFKNVGIASILLVLFGLVGLEPRTASLATAAAEERASHGEIIGAVAGNPQARLFFIYLIILLGSLLGQDVLLEPFGAHAFNLSVKETTHLTAIWGASTMSALLLHGFLFNRWFNNKQGSIVGAVVAGIGLLTIGMSGLFAEQAIFIPGIVLLGFGTGMATSTNLALMLGMTSSGQTGVFIGAWGVADALSRALGNFLSGIGRDTITHFTNSTTGYVSIFLIEAGLLMVSIFLLKYIDDHGVRNEKPSISDVIAIAGDAS